MRDVARPGKPRQYDTDVEAQITALACSAPPGWSPSLDYCLAGTGSAREGLHNPRHRAS
ncbi:MAG: helix-turn-helix domain-containing protein [Thiobacillus sp.]